MLAYTALSVKVTSYQIRAFSHLQFHAALEEKLKHPGRCLKSKNELTDFGYLAGLLPSFLLDTRFAI